MIKLFNGNLFGRRSAFGVDDYGYGTSRRRGVTGRFAVPQELYRQSAVLFAFLAVGSVIGAIAASMLNNDDFGRLFRNVEVYISGGLAVGAAGTIIIENIIKYGKTAFSIWLFGFVPRFAFMGLFLVAGVGVRLGFTTAILTRGFGLNGILYAAALYFPQTLILIPAYFYAAAGALNQMKKHGEPQMFGARFNRVNNNLSAEYFMRLLPIAALTALASGFEWAVTPALFSLIT